MNFGAKISYYPLKSGDRDFFSSARTGSAAVGAALPFLQGRDWLGVNPSFVLSPGGRTPAARAFQALVGYAMAFSPGRANEARPMLNTSATEGVSFVGDRPPSGRGSGGALFQGLKTLATFVRPPGEDADRKPQDNSIWSEALDRSKRPVACAAARESHTLIRLCLSLR